ncbi:MAG TPA: hypothetical protein VHO47_05625 [Candidatus Babeliales bacterium]|nr:hypothetical protein [Candidatus Babeliales bacterium]
MHIQGKEIIVLTAALADNNFEFRKQQYIKAFKTLKKYRYKKFYIIEALKKNGPTFLDEYSKNVFYSGANNFSLRDKGLNEGITMLEGLRHFRFDTDDMIIKLTGRWCLVSKYFLKLVKKNRNKYHAIAKVCNKYALTQCFAMRYAQFLKMLQSFDYHALDQKGITIERAVGGYLADKAASGELRVLFIDKLDIGVDPFGSTTYPHHLHGEVRL